MSGSVNRSPALLPQQRGATCSDSRRGRQSVQSADRAKSTAGGRGVLSICTISCLEKRDNSVIFFLSGRKTSDGTGGSHGETEDEGWLETGEQHPVTGSRSSSSHQDSSFWNCHHLGELLDYFDWKTWRPVESPLVSQCCVIENSHNIVTIL